MPSAFPASVDTFSAKADHVTTIAAADVNNLQNAVVAIESTLHSAPSPNPLDYPSKAEAADYVSKTKAETISGLKSFSASPIVLGAGWTVDANGNLGVRSVTASAGNGPYTPSALALLLASSSAAAMGTIGILPPPRGSGQDDSANLQSAIDAMSAAGGGELWGWGDYIGNIVLKQGVVLRGPGSVRTPWTSVAFRLTAFAAGYAIDTPVTAINSCGIDGVGVQGLGAGTAGGGIRYQNVIRGFAKNFTANNFADEGIVAKSACLACTFEDIFVQNCVLNTTRVAAIGAVDLDGTDHYIGPRIEATASSGSTVTSASLFVCAIVIRGSTHFVDTIVGETSDVGVHVLANRSRFSICRADKNNGHGWNVFGGGNTFLGCQGLSNSQDTTNTYDNFRADNASGNNVYSGCLADNAQANVTKYGFEDLVTSQAIKNFYINCLSIGAATKQYSISTNNGSAMSFAAGTWRTLTANSTTPDVTGYERFLTANSSGTTITDFPGGVQGQRILIFCNDSNTTIQHNGATISLRGGGNKKLISGVYYEFTLVGGLWRDVKPYPFSVSADNGDAAKNLQADVAETTQVWATALTANRAVTLSTTGPYIGAKFRVVRKASATGASTLDVGTGPLKSLALGQWCDVEYDGAAWFLSAFGSL